ncbi:MAG TPA: hypothetical protein VLI44_03255 [Sporolactobacillaceae bacterium]|nr:hypothetical protein [Sporolactobacillaceae bacterium]
MALALGLFFVSHAFAQSWRGCGIVSYSSPSTPGYQQGGGPSGFNVGDLPDADFTDLPQGVVITVPEPSSSSRPNAIAYGNCIFTETIDEGICYDVDDSGTITRNSDCDE